MSYFVRNKLVLLKNTFFLKIKSKFNKGLHEIRVIHTNPYKTFWILIPVYFTFRKFKINGTVALCQKKKQFVTVTKSLITRANICIY